jgi:N-acetylmuramoyl-L-alanine amidase
MFILTQLEVCEDQRATGTAYGRKNPYTAKQYADLCYNEMVDFSVDFFKTYFKGDSNMVTNKTLTSHAEANQMGIASNHGDPWHWLGKYGYSGDTLRSAVKAKLQNGGSSGGSGGSTAKLYRVQIGAYKNKSNADATLKKARNAGFKDAFIRMD